MKRDMQKKIFFLVCIFVAALTLRVYAWGRMSPAEKVLKSDDYRYDQIAVGMLEGKGFAKDGQPIAWRGPGYPLFLAGIYLVFGHNPDAVRVVQCILGALLCIFLYYIGAHTFNKKTGCIAALVAAVYLPFIKYLYWAGPCFLFSESVFTFLVTLTVLVILRWHAHKNTVNLVLVGVVSAATALTKPSFLVCMPLLFFWFLFEQKNIPKAAKDYMLVAAVFILCIMPWTIRNYAVFHEFIPLSNESGDIFLEGNNPLARGSSVWVGQEMDSDQELLKKYSATEIKNMKYKIALRYLLEHPRRIPYLFTKKLLVTWNFFSERGTYNFSYGLVLLFAAAGLCMVTRQRSHWPGALLLVLMFVWVSAVCMMFFGHPRYRYPIEPCLIVAGAYGIGMLFTRAISSLRYTVGMLIIGVNVCLYMYGPSVLRFLQALVP